MTWPYESGEPLRCAHCGQAPAIRVRDRAPGPWCRRCMPWRPALPVWAVGRCRRCTSKGVRLLDNRGRLHGPFCRAHAPEGWRFDAIADDNLKIAVESAMAAPMKRRRRSS